MKENFFSAFGVPFSLAYMYLPIAAQLESVYFVYFPLFGVLGGELVVATDLSKAVITSFSLSDPFGFGIVDTGLK